MEIGKIYRFLESSVLRDILRGSHWVALTESTFEVYTKDGIIAHPETGSYIWNCGNIENLKPYTEDIESSGIIVKYISKFKFNGNTIR